MKKTVKRRSKDVEAAVLWFANTLRLMNTLKQYSGEQMFQEENTPTMNAQCLQSFDLLEYRQVLSDIGIYIYQVRFVFDDLSIKNMVRGYLLRVSNICRI